MMVLIFLGKQDNGGLPGPLETSKPAVHIIVGNVGHPCANCPQRCLQPISFGLSSYRERKFLLSLELRTQKAGIMQAFALFGGLFWTAQPLLNDSCYEYGKTENSNSGYKVVPAPGFGYTLLSCWLSR